MGREERIRYPGGEGAAPPAPVAVEKGAVQPAAVSIAVH
jgi:hypothetical protein